MADINTGAYRTRRHGGIITLTDKETTTTYDNLVGTENGSLAFSPGLHQRAVDYEKGTLKTTVRRLDERPSSFEIAFKTTGFATTSLYALLQDDIKGTDDGSVRAWDVVFKSGASSAATSGETITFSDCVVEEGGLSFTEGDEYDLVRVRFTCPHPVPTLGTFAP